MHTYYITVSTMLSGYNFDVVIDADTEEEARKQAIEEAEEMIRIMARKLYIQHVEED